MNDTREAFLPQKESYEDKLTRISRSSRSSLVRTDHRTAHETTYWSLRNLEFHGITVKTLSQMEIVR